MNHSWKPSGADEVCRYCSTLRIGANDDEDCPELKRRAELHGTTPEDEVELAKLDELDADIAKAARDQETADVPIQYQVNQLRKQLARLVAVIKGE